ncbi:MAG: hypothetical protein ACPGWS_05490 [Solirubrobacterales bacterium]
MQSVRWIASYAVMFGLPGIVAGMTARRFSPLVVGALTAGAAAAAFWGVTLLNLEINRAAPQATAADAQLTLQQEAIAPQATRGQTAAARGLQITAL